MKNIDVILIFNTLTAVYELTRTIFIYARRRLRINLYQRRSIIRTGSAAYFCIIGFLVIFLCIVAPPVVTRSRGVEFVFFYRTSCVGLTSRQHLATAIRYADCVKQPFRPFDYRDYRISFSSIRL